MTECSSCASSRTAILIVGMHRSGTSALTRIINLLGADLPVNLLPPQKDNILGFWESADICKLNDDILLSVGLHWHHSGSFPSDWIKSSSYNVYKERARELLQYSFSDSFIFVLKDPRFCFLLPFWVDVLQDAGVQVKCILSLRNPLEVAESLYKRDGFSVEKSYALWLRYVLDSEMLSRELPRVFVTYNELLDDWRTTILKISTGLDITWPCQLVDIEDSVNAFLCRSNRHHLIDDSEIFNNDSVWRWVKKSYRCLLDLQNDICSKKLISELDGIRDEFGSVVQLSCSSLIKIVEDKNKYISYLEENISDCKYDSDVSYRESSVLKSILQERFKYIHELERLLYVQYEKNKILEDNLVSITTSSSWTITKPFRWLRRLMTDPLKWSMFILSELKCSLKTVSACEENLKEEPLCLEYPKEHYVYAPPRRLDKFTSWLLVNKFNNKDRRDLSALLEKHKDYLPKMSVIMPVYNTNHDFLTAAVQSVRSQLYENWELCLVNDASSEGGIREILDDFSAIDERIKVVHCQENGGISKATNIAVSVATGDVLAFLDHDDLLTENALAEVALYYAVHREADIVYSDDDKIDIDGNFFAPQFKPDWAPVLLLSYMYLSHLFTVRKSLFDALGGFRSDFDGSQDYDFALRAVEQARHIGHIPKILYHWRVVPGSTAESGDAKPASFEAGRLAVMEALRRRGIEYAEVIHPSWARESKVGIFEIFFSCDGPSVSIIIPSKNNHKMLNDCLESLKKTSYQNYEVIVIDNDSDELETIRYLESLNSECRVIKIKNHDGKFNFSALINEAARLCTSKYVLFLNDDTRVISRDWLSQMVGYAEMDGVGVVGAKLLFTDETIQHAGIVHGYYNDLAGPAFRGLEESEWGYLGYLMVSREYSAVTGACLLTERELFLSLGGFDENMFAVAYNDVDYCYRLVDVGFSSVYCASARLYHYEGKSRGFIDNPREIKGFRKKYFDRIDTYYNQNLSLSNERFEISSVKLPSNRQEAVKTVMFSHNLNHEGAPNSMVELVVGLRDNGVIDPVVISPYDGPLRMVYESAGIPVTIIQNPLEQTNDQKDFFENLSRLQKMLLESNVEVVYANTLQTFWGLLAASAAGITSVWNIRESEAWETYFDYLPEYLRALAYSTFFKVYRVIFVSHSSCEGWGALNIINNFQVIPNGLDINRVRTRAKCFIREDVRKILGVEDGELVVLLLGTVCERKGQIDLINAVNELPEQILSRLRFFIIGDRNGEYSDILHRRLLELPVSVRSRMVLMEETEEPYFYFKAADIALCTSRIESYPRVILEAMAFSLPIITTPAFGIVEQVKERVNAIFYQPGDYKELASAITRITEDENLRQVFAGNSKYVLDGLINYDEMLVKYGRIFREAVQCQFDVSIQDMIEG